MADMYAKGDSRFEEQWEDDLSGVPYKRSDLKREYDTRRLRFKYDLDDYGRDTLMRNWVPRKEYPDRDI